VLSGGGARGTTHIGVLKVLDDLHIPVDAIAGTSMGAVVGGLYASGMSGRDIEQLLGTVDWQDAFRDRPKRSDLAFRRKQEDLDFLVNLPLGVRGRRLLIPTGLIQGQKLTQILRRATLPVATVADFDNLAARFRAVATDLETGNAVVMGSGDLTTAMRASMSAPGVFAPVERDGRMLVDGGLVKNLPIDVARELGVDVLIVVDAGTPLESRENLGSLTSVSNQAVAIMVRRDADAQRATLGARDVLIEPRPADVSSYDFSVVDRTIAAGEAAARAMESSLRRYAIDEADYQRYQAARQAVRGAPPVVQFVRADSSTPAFQRQVSETFADQVGKSPDAQQLETEVKTLYGRGNLESLDYRLVTDDRQRYGLDISARRNSWGPNYLRLGLSLQDDFEGNSSYNAAARLVFTELNSLGAEWLWDMQIGASPRLANELYLPLATNARYFLAPHVQFEAHDVPQLVNEQQVGIIRVRSAEAGIDAGREFGNWGELRTGLLRNRGTERVKLGDFSMPDTRFAVNAAFVRFGYDRLDSANFPRSGQALRLEMRVEDSGRADLGTDLLRVDWRMAVSRGKNTAIAWFSGGSTVGGNDRNVRTYYPLGGFLNLSGMRANSIAGPHYAVARAIFLRKVGSGGEGVLNVPAYAGLSLELGNVWAQRSQISLDSARTNAALFFGADTYIGPAYLAAGYDESGASAFYLFLGRSF
jgi:NTE family protein